MTALTCRHLFTVALVSLTAGIAGLAAPAPRLEQAPRLRILVIHGPNLNLLGRREPQIYGTTTLEQINARLTDVATELNVELLVLQSNTEGVIVDFLQKHMDDADGAILNAAGLTFSSVSIHDAMKAVSFPVIEVHISNLATRDEIHQRSILTPAARGAVTGLGWRSYTAALRAVVEIVREERAARR
jgi:3-dehydroquinate dehydratase-2